MTNLLARAGFDWFLLALIGVIVLASQWPEVGVQEEPVSLSEIAGYGVTLIFFFYGLRLNPRKLREGLGNWRLHLVVHLATFVIFPLLLLAVKPLISGERNQLLWLGAFYLAALPSTVSSSVVMVSIAGGNMLAAIFNASISSLLGVFITPLWMGLFLATSSGDYDISVIIAKLMLQVLAPVLLGLLLNKRLGTFAEKYRKQMRYFDQVVILLIVYTSFCESFALNMFEGYSSGDILKLAGLMVGLFFLVYLIIYGISRLLNFNREDRIAALFCGSKKSLVQGTVMSKVLFPDATIIGVVLLPIMLYHALQLIAASIIAQAMARKAGGE
ncbi:bile acid:sodium symporter family protein [Botryobacter ruber]|uniref:bile acid:sodium symporter family protein n=1 Tax=Botryobacter ruber TaxID=2171629 RepID=UPI00196A9058|nr:bile acid:sodium symporter family protein [Botryobacter ruber]